MSLLNIPRAIDITYDCIKVWQEHHPNFVLGCLRKGKIFWDFVLPWMQIYHPWRFFRVCGLTSELSKLDFKHIVSLLVSISCKFLMLLYVVHVWRKLICSGESCTGETTAVDKFSCLVNHSSKSLCFSKCFIKVLGSCVLLPVKTSNSNLALCYQPSHLRWRKAILKKPSCVAWQRLCQKVNLQNCLAQWPLCDKVHVNLPSCQAQRPLCHKVNLPSCVGPV